MEYEHLGRLGVSIVLRIRAAASSPVIAPARMAKTWECWQNDSGVDGPSQYIFLSASQQYPFTASMSDRDCSRYSRAIQSRPTAAFSVAACCSVRATMRL